MSIGHAIRRYTSDKPRASRRYRRFGRSTRRVCPGSVSCNRGFSYADAMRIVRPELAAKLVAPASHQADEKPACGRPGLWVESEEGVLGTLGGAE